MIETPSAASRLCVGSWVTSRSPKNTFPSVGVSKPAMPPQESGLATTTPAQQKKQLTWGDLERNMIKGGHVAKSLCDSFGPDFFHMRGMLELPEKKGKSNPPEVFLSPSPHSGSCGQVS